MESCCTEDATTYLGNITVCIPLAENERTFEPKLSVHSKKKITNKQLNTNTTNVKQSTTNRQQPTTNNQPTTKIQCESGVLLIATKGFPLLGPAPTLPLRYTVELVRGK